MMRKIKFLIILGFILIFSGSVLGNGAMKIVNPRTGEEINDGDTISTSSVKLIVTPSADEPFILYKAARTYDIENRRARKLCRNCKEGEEYSRRLRLSSGSNTIEVLDGINEEIEIIVDRRAPRITKITPRSGDYSDGIISVSITEKNLKSVKLLTRLNTENWDVGEDVTEDCVEVDPKKGRWKCELDSGFYGEGDYVLFYLEVSDGISTTTSNVMSMRIDTIDPVFDLINPEDGVVPRNFLLQIGVDEPATIKYKIDYKERTRTLCRDCTYKEKRIRLRPGDHTITFIAEDKAGNIGEDYIYVTVV